MPTLKVAKLVEEFACRPSSTCILAALIIAFSAIIFSSPSNADRGRVRVQNGTVVSDRNTILRGSAMSVLKGPGNSANPSYWRHMSVNLRLNAVRLGVKTGQIGRTIAQQLPYIDNAVNSAAQNNMYVMILSSDKAGQYNLHELRTFWGVIAKRYKDRTHVLYEMANEPVSGGPHWGNVPQYNSKVIGDLTSIYHIMRQGAPNTHIVMLSPGNLYPDCQSYSALISRFKGIDWSKTSVGFHHYNGTYKFGESGLQCLRKQYPLIMTETSYWNEPARLILKHDLAMYERIRMSWFSLDGKGSFHYLEGEILPNLRRAGYNWNSEN
jgi:hypothetical protein